MADRPILFSGPMVRALLDGRKTQTRRVLTGGRMSLFNGEWSDSYVLDPGNADWRQRDVRFAVGDRLWVREAWHAARSLDSVRPRDIPRDADIEHACTARDYAAIGLKGKLRPSMFMPREFSRLTLVAPEVRVERLQDISDADARAEGVKPDVFDGPEGWEECTRTDHVSAFRRLWDGLNAKRGVGWDANPWVVAVSFNVVRANIDRMTASPHSPLQDDADAPVSVIKDSGPPDNAGAPAPRSAFDRDGEVNHG